MGLLAINIGISGFQIELRVTVDSHLIGAIDDADVRYDCNDNSNKPVKWSRVLDSFDETGHHSFDLMR